MSVKAQALVWDFECPQKIGELTFKPSHKYVLIKYADHADHNGKNIWPAIWTISNLTGLDERSVQRLTRDLEQMGLLVACGKGPKGTNKWSLPYSDGGDKLSPCPVVGGDKNEDSLGDIPSGDIPSGDKLTPESNEPEPLIIDSDPELNLRVWQPVIDQLQKDLSHQFFAKVQDTKVLRFDGNALMVGVCNPSDRDWLESRLQSTVENLLVGILAQNVDVTFVVAEGTP